MEPPRAFFNAWVEQHHPDWETNLSLVNGATLEIVDLMETLWEVFATGHWHGQTMAGIRMARQAQEIVNEVKGATHVELQPSNPDGAPHPRPATVLPAQPDRRM